MQFKEVGYQMQHTKYLMSFKKIVTYFFHFWRHYDSLVRLFHGPQYHTSILLKTISLEFYAILRPPLTLLYHLKRSILMILGKLLQKLRSVRVLTDIPVSEKLFCHKWRHSTDFRWMIKLIPQQDGPNYNTDISYPEIISFEFSLKSLVRFIRSVRFVGLTITSQIITIRQITFLQFMRSFLFILILILCSNTEIWMDWKIYLNVIC